MIGPVNLSKQLWDDNMGLLVTAAAIPFIGSFWHTKDLQVLAQDCEGKLDEAVDER